jgi:hypothetical protein
MESKNEDKVFWTLGTFPNVKFDLLASGALRLTSAGRVVIKTPDAIFDSLWAASEQSNAAPAGAFGRSLLSTARSTAQQAEIAELTRQVILRDADRINLQAELTRQLAEATQSAFSNFVRAKRAEAEIVALRMKVAIIEVANRQGLDRIEARDNLIDHLRKIVDKCGCS